MLPRTIGAPVGVPPEAAVSDVAEPLPLPAAVVPAVVGFELLPHALSRPQANKAATTAPCALDRHHPSKGSVTFSSFRRRFGARPRTKIPAPTALGSLFRASRIRRLQSNGATHPCRHRALTITKTPHAAGPPSPTAPARSWTRPTSPGARPPHGPLPAKPRPTSNSGAEFRGPRSSAVLPPSLHGTGYSRRNVGERLGVGVVLVEVFVDGGDEVVDTGEDPAARRFATPNERPHRALFGGHQTRSRRSRRMVVGSTTLRRRPGPMIQGVPRTSHAWWQSCACAPYAGRQTR